MSTITKDIEIVRPILDNDTLFIFAVVFFTTLENINPYVVFFAAVIAIIVGVFKIIEFYWKFKDRQKNKRDDPRLR